MRSKYDVVFESMDPKETAEFTRGDPERIKFMKQIKDQKNMENYVKNNNANNQNPGTFKKLVKEDEKQVPTTRLKPLIDIEKTLEKYEDDPLEKRGQQTLALNNVGNRILNEQIKRGNIKKEDLILTTTNGTDNIDVATNDGSQTDLFDESFFSKKGLSFSVNADGELLVTV